MHVIAPANATTGQTSRAAATPDASSTRISRSAPSRPSATSTPTNIAKGKICPATGIAS